jgi:ribosome-binding ATPase YchF (GTP1/OBG family)
VVNIGEDDVEKGDVIAAPVVEAFSTAATPVEVLPICVQVEAEAARLAQEDRAELLEAMGIGEGALPRLVHAAYSLLGRRTFLTTGDKESRAWTFRAGARAPECAGVIHTDFQRGFIKAECIRWDELLGFGSWNKAKEAGKVRIEGKDYEVLDGDVLEFRFNV